MTDQTKRITVIVVVSIFFGLMFNFSMRTAALTKQVVAQQGEILDLLKLSRDKETKIGQAIVDIGTKLKNGGGLARGPQRPPENFNKVYTIPYKKSEIIGNPKAPVTIVGFLDLQCPFSRRFQPVIDQVLKAYPKQVKFVVKDFPLSFHPHAKPAAKALLAAGQQGKLAEMLNLILENNTQLSHQEYLDLAKKIGLNMRRFKKALKDDDKAWDADIQKDIDLGRNIDVRGTPTYYLNGKKTRARTFEAFKTEIDKILKK